MSTDLYAELGIDNRASQDDIKRAYKKKARQYHPDVNKDAGAEESFKRIQKSYSILSDAQKKAQYDQYGVADDSAGGGQGGGGFGGQGTGDFEDIFDSFFGGNRTRKSSGAVRGDDLRYDLEISLEEAASGVEKDISIYHLESCDTCKGDGAKPGTSKKTCSQCNGQGQVQSVQRSFLGNFTQVVTCPGCRGAGAVIESPCGTCNGSGNEKKQKKLTTNIPGGVEPGVKLRLNGEGNAGTKGGRPGDLYVFIDVMEHPFFERDNNDVYLELRIPFTQLILGTTAIVPTLKGNAKLKIPSGTQSNTKFRLKGKGIPKLNGYGTGDLYVIVHADIPVGVSGKEKNLVETLYTVRGDEKKDGEKVARF